MSQAQRLTVWLVVMLLCMTALCFWSWQQLQTQQHLAKATVNDQLKCQRLASEIQAIRDTAQTQKPEDQINTLVQQIQQAADQASMPMSHVQRIRPATQRRMGQSAYLEKPTQLSLSNITLQKTIAFLHHLVSLQPDLQIQSMRLTEARKNPTSNLWQVEVGLATVVYAPVVRKPRHSKKKVN